MDLNLLVALDALLAERSVTAAARRLGLSASATSRALTRLRAATGDELLVRAGRGLVPTPHAAALRDKVQAVLAEARMVLGPLPEGFDPAGLSRDFAIRAGEGFVGLMAAPLVAAMARVAPGVRLRFVPKPEKTAEPLRDGTVDLEIGTAGLAAPEVRTRLLFRDAFVGVVRAGHALLSGPVTPARYAACRHVVASRKAGVTGPVDRALAALGLERRIAAVVPGFPDALVVASGTDLVALVPRSSLRAAPEGMGLVGFALPVPTPELAIHAFWHPRLEADPAQRWFRDLVATACRDHRAGE